MKTILNFIGGSFTPSLGGRWLDDIEPATGLAYARLPDSNAMDVDQAVASASAAFDGWSRTLASERSKLLARAAALIDERAEELARAESIDSGKPLALARVMDIPRASANFRFFASLAEQWGSQSYSQALGGAPAEAALHYTLRSPLGVVGLISPWNLPIYLLSWKIAPAIAAGNTCVCKPSEETPMTAFLLSEILRDAGIPPGVVNIVHGTGASAGAALVAHPKVKAISFTGGTSTGATISRVAAPMFKKLSLELGGKNPTLVFEDADLDVAVPQAVRAAFTNQGQVCLCGSRVYVSRGIEGEFTRRFVELVDRMVVGDPLEAGTDQGALVSRAHLEKVRACVKTALEEGGRVLNASAQNPLELPPRCAGGFFHRPVVLGGLGAASRTQQEEIFGPVVTITPFENEREALELANGVRYGLAASVWTRDLSRGHRMAEHLQAGLVWINCWLVRDLRVPFGGVKDSGVGREGGEDAMRFFTEPRSVCVKYAL